MPVPLTSLPAADGLGVSEGGRPAIIEASTNSLLGDHFDLANSRLKQFPGSDDTAGLGYYSMLR
jgi:hypothetical protein